MANPMTEVGARLRLRDRPQFVRDADKAGDAIERLERRTNSAGLAARVTAGAYSGLRSMASSVASVVTHGATAMVGGAALMGGAFVKMGLESAAGYEQAEIALGNMLKSPERAKEMVKEIETYAIKSPFAFPDVLQSTRALVAMGVEGDKVLGMIKVIGDASAGLGAGSEGVERMSRALGQMKAKGFPSGEEMRQLADTGVRAWEYLAKSIGKSIPETMKRAERRLISGEAAVSAILAGMAGDFKDQTKDQLQTLSGRWEEFRDLLRRSARVAMTPFIGDIKKGLIVAGKYFETFGKYLEKNVPVWQMMFKHGWNQGYLNKELGNAYQRLYYFGDLMHAVFGKGVEDRLAAIGRAFTMLIDPTGNLTELLGKAKDMWDDIWETVRDGILPIFSALPAVLMLVIAPLSQLDDVLGWLADNTRTVRTVTILMLIAFGGWKVIDLYQKAVFGVVRAYQAYMGQRAGLAATNALVIAGWREAKVTLWLYMTMLKEWLVLKVKELIMNARVAASWLLYKVRMLAVNAVLIIHRGIQLAVRAATLAWAAAQWLLNAAMAANPIGLVVIAIAALIAGIWYAYTHFDWFRNAVDAAWQALQVFWDWISKIILNAWDRSGMDSYFTNAAENIREIIGFLSDVWDWIQKLNGAIVEIEIKIPGTDMSVHGGDALRGFLLGNPITAPFAGFFGGRARGGDIERTGMYHVGENGPESVVLPRGATVRPDDPSNDDGYAAMPARFQVLDGGRVLFDIVRENAQDEGARL